MHEKLVWRFWTPFVVLRSWGRGVVQCIFELFRTHHMNEKLVCRFWTWCYGRGAVQSYSTLHHMHEKLVWRFGTPFMVLRSGVVQCICDLFHTHTTCLKGSFGDFGHHSWCYSREVVQCICELFHTHHMPEKLVWRFGHHSWCYGRGVVQCICEPFHTHHTHEKLVWTFWTAFNVLRSGGRPMYM